MYNISLDETKNVLFINDIEYSLWGKDKNKDEVYDFLLECIEDKDFSVLISGNADYFPNKLSVSGCFHEGFEHLDFFIVTRIDSKFKISGSFDYRWNKWDHSIPFEDYLENLLIGLGAINDSDSIESNLDHDNNILEISIDFSCPAYTAPKKKILDIARNIRELHYSICTKLFSKNNANRLLVNLNLKEEYRPAIIQYLSYFTEFLVGLGIKATSSLQQFGERTLFEVTPETKEEAIEKIYQALDIFLNLPEKTNNISISPIATIEAEVRTQQLLSVVEHLRSQLRLSQALVSIKEQELSIYRDQQSENLRSIIKMDVVEAGTENSELKLLGGIIKIQEYKGKFFNIDVPKIIKSVLSKTGHI